MKLHYYYFEQLQYTRIDLYMYMENTRAILIIRDFFHIKICLMLRIKFIGTLNKKETLQNKIYQNYDPMV